jgi:hypothetical protein
MYFARLYQSIVGAFADSGSIYENKDPRVGWIGSDVELIDDLMQNYTYAEMVVDGETPIVPLLRELIRHAIEAKKMHPQVDFLMHHMKHHESSECPGYDPDTYKNPRS